MSAAIMAAQNRFRKVQPDNTGRSFSVEEKLFLVTAGARLRIREDDEIDWMVARR